MDFTLKGEFIQLDKLLKVAGLVGTGGEAKLLIQDGLVLVDGEVETRRGRKIRAGMRIDFDAVSLLVTNKQDL